MLSSGRYGSLYARPRTLIKQSSFMVSKNLAMFFRTHSFGSKPREHMIVRCHKDKGETQQRLHQIAMEVQNILHKGVGILHTKQCWVNARQVGNIPCFVMAESYEPLQVSGLKKFIPNMKPKTTWDLLYIGQFIVWQDLWKLKIATFTIGSPSWSIVSHLNREPYEKK